MISKKRPNECKEEYLIRVTSLTLEDIMKMTGFEIFMLFYLLVPIEEGRNND